MQKDYITIELNGEAFNCPKSMKLYDLLIYLGFDTRSIAIEYNNEMLSGSQMSTINLSMQDKIEIVTIVGGG